MEQKVNNKFSIYGIYAIALGLPLLPSILLKLLILVTFAVYFFEARNDFFSSRKIDIPLMLYIIIWVTSTIFSVSRLDSFDSLVVHIIAVTGYLLCRNILKEKKQIIITISLLMVSTAFVAAYGVLQWFIGGSGNKAWVDKTANPELNVRVSSIMRNPNNLAEFLVLVIPVVIGLFLYKKEKINKLFIGLCGGVMILCLLLTYSRSAWLGFAIGMLVFVFLLNKKLIFIATVFLPMFVLMLPNVMFTRVVTIIDSMVSYLTGTHIMDSSVSYRVDIWDTATTLIKEYWYCGIGFGETVFGQMYPMYKGWAIMADHAHNLFLEITVEMGVLGIIIFAIFIIRYLAKSIKASIASETFKKYILMALVASVVGLLVNGIFEYVLFYYKVLYGMWFLIGIAVALRDADIKG